MTSAPKARFTDKARATVSAILTHALAEELLLSSMTRGFSGTVPAFQSLHRLFADQYHQLEGWLDRLAARTCAFGTPGVKIDELVTARCVDLPEHMPEQTMVSELLALHEQLAERLRLDVDKCAQQLGDEGTADILSRLAEFHDTTAWMLRMVLHGPEAPRVGAR
jgi:starvation-inducible DNA-binding protein